MSVSRYSTYTLKIWSHWHNGKVNTLVKVKAKVEPRRVFYVYGSVYRWSILIIVQRDATQNSLFIILQVHSICFGCQPHPSSGIHKTVTTASGTGHAFLCRYLPPSWPSWPRWREVAAQKIWPVSEAVVTVLFTPDDGCGWHLKHIEWTCRIINRLFCVASRWAIINLEEYFSMTMMIWTRYK